MFLAFCKCVDISPNICTWYWKNIREKKDMKDTSLTYQMIDTIQITMRVINFSTLKLLNILKESFKCML